MADDTEVIELQDARKKRQTTRGSAYRAPALPAVRFLSDAHRAHLRDTSGLNDETISLANVYSVDSRNEAIELLGRVSNLPRGSLLVLPFYLPGGAEPYAYRVRPDEPRVVRAAEGEQKPRVVKYDQPSGAGVMVYYAPRARASGAYRDVAQPLYWTEGEKKALALDQLGYTTVGLTGVWNWSDPEARKAHAWALHARIREHVQIAGREHVIVFDRDAATNRDVAQAMRQLARTLRAAGARSVFVVLPPEYTEAKGIDDYLVAAGVDALRELLAFRPAEYAAHDAPTDSKVVTLASLPALRDAPLPDGLVLPDGWDVDSAGRVWAGGKEVMSRVMVVARRSVDTNTGECWADLVFHPGDRRGWQVLTVPRRALLDARAMAGELMPRGAPVHGGTARGATAWFLALELANARALEPERSVSSTGWVGSDAFMLHELVFANEALGLVPSPILGRLTPALTPRGSVDAHESALRAAWASSPVQRVAICAALAAPKTCFNTAVVRATGFSRICFSSTATIVNKPSIAFWVT